MFANAKAVKEKQKEEYKKIVKLQKEVEKDFHQGRYVSAFFKGCFGICGSELDEKTDNEEQRTPSPLK